MAKYTKYLEFSTKERVAIKERDNYQCIFCQIGYKMPLAAVLEMDITDIMHYIPRSSMGLGIRQNGAVGCRAPWMSVVSGRTELSDAGTTII